MQPTYHEIQRFIPRIFQRSNVEIEQIVCMEQNINQSYKNLEVFYAILPLCFSLRGYNVLYYYDSMSSHVNSMISMPNTLIVRDYVVQFDYEMEHGIVIRSDTYVRTMHKQYKTMCKKSCSLLVKGNNPKWRNGYFSEGLQGARRLLQPLDMRGEDDLQEGFSGGGYFSEQLYMGNCLDRDLLERCFYPAEGKAEFIDELIAIRGSWDEGKYTAPNHADAGIIAYGTYASMEEFMKTGRIKEFPEEWYAPLSFDERILVLNRMIDLAKSEQMDYHFVSSRVALPGNIQIYWNEDRKRFGLNRVTTKELFQVVVDEQSIYRTFQMYLEYLEKKGMVWERKKG